MKKIILVSLCTPTVYNMRAASALPYHLIRGAKEAYGEDIQFEIYSFNSNNVDVAGVRQSEKQLDAKIHLLCTPWWQQWLFRLHLLFLRILLRYPLGAYFHLPNHVTAEIRNKQADTLWIYGEDIMHLAKLFPEAKIICTMPDCESMYYYRLLRKRFATQRLSQVIRYTFAYWQYRRMERDHYDPRVTYHFVGKVDREFFEGINPGSKTVFLRHPLYQSSSLSLALLNRDGASRQFSDDINQTAGRKFHSPIRIVVPGRYDIYQQEAMNELVPELCKPNDLKQHYVITFLGKDWETPAAQMKDAGWTVTIKTWVDDYAAELRQHDIALYPISVGTGTKGRVLDAFANGLLVIGTVFSLENIEAEGGCVLYQKASEVSELLYLIRQDTCKYEKTANVGQQLVLENHNRAMIAKKMWEACKLSL